MQCDYYKDINAIWKMGLIEMIDHINATRLLYIAPKDRVEAFVMKEQRNRVHLYRSKSEPPAIYNKHYADSIVNMFYVIVNQLNTTEWYFGCAEACLKNIDEDGYNETKKVNYLQDELYEAIHSSQYLRKLFDGEKVSFEEQNQLKCALKNNQIKNYASAVALVLVGAQFGHYEDEWYTTKVDDFYNRIKENSGCSNAKIKELKREVERYYNSIVTTI